MLAFFEEVHGKGTTPSAFPGQDLAPISSPLHLRCTVLFSIPESLELPGPGVAKGLGPGDEAHTEVRRPCALTPSPFLVYDKLSHSGSLIHTAGATIVTDELPVDRYLL